VSGKETGTAVEAAPGWGVDRPFMMRGVRGATTVREDRPEAIEAAVHELLGLLVARNGMAADDLAAAFFSVTEDLRSAFPAAGARSFGWCSVPLLDVREAAGDDDLERCVRVLLLWNTRRSPQEIRHVYLHGAAALRPDLTDSLARVPFAGA
jgi:chorismate mutase